MSENHDVYADTRSLIQARAKEIRKATPDCLKELFEMSNRICDLCEHPIQDLMLTALDHSIPVIRYARCLDISIDDAIRECNEPTNLRVAHRSCNAAKNDMSRDEWFARGLNNREAPRLMTDSELLEFQFRIGAGGRVSGRKAAESGHLASICSKGGRKNVESGHIQALGRKMVESGHFVRISKLPQSKEAQRRNGRINGRINGRKAVESGQLARIHKLPQSIEANRRNGCIQGRRNVESGHIQALGRKAAESGHLASICSKGGRKNVESGHIQALGHKRWHVSRGISKPETCSLCRTVSDITPDF